LIFYNENKIFIKYYFFNIGKKCIYFFFKKKYTKVPKVSITILKKISFTENIFNLNILYKKNERVNIIFYKIKYNYINLTNYFNLYNMKRNILKIN
jgi:hypothetical protein